VNDALPALSKRFVGYYPAWAIHAQKFHISDIPADKLTHVIYAFANVTAAGDCASLNTDDDSINFPQLIQLKHQHPALQSLISIGGASHSANFPHVASTDAARTYLAQSCVQFMKQHGFDGVDIDWEYPKAKDRRHFTALLKELRRQLDVEGDTDGRRYLLTIAAPVGPSHFVNLEIALIHPLLDWINLMSYDFHTASSGVTNFDAPLFPASDSPTAARDRALNVDSSVKCYLAAGVPADKIVLGVRFVATGWAGVEPINNGLYQPNTGAAPGTWDRPGATPSGSFGYQDLEENYLPTFTRLWHGEAEVPWLFSSETGIMISYEDPQSLGLKANYVLSHKLGGVMIWDLSADDDQNTLLNALIGMQQQAPVDGDPYTISGTVTSPDSASVGGLQVSLVDKGVGPDAPVAATTTDTRGRYSIAVTISTAALQVRRKTQPDFQVRVSAGATFLAASEIAFNAGKTVTLDVALPAHAKGLASEYETLTAALATNYVGPLSDLQETAARQDITFLANKTGWDARGVALAALADQFSQITIPAPSPLYSTSQAPVVSPPPATASTPARLSIKPEFYYALFRAGLPANAEGLFQASTKTVEAVWTQAINQGVISETLTSEVAAAVGTFQILAAAYILDAKPPVGISTLKEMLQTSLSEAGQQQIFATLYSQHRDDPATFWDELEKTLGGAPTKKLQLSGQLFYLTLNNAKLVSALFEAEGPNEITSTLDLATRGYYDPAKWTPLIGSAIPAQIPGKTIEEQRSNYAQLLATHVRLAFPTIVAAGHVLSGNFRLLNSSIQQDVAGFLTSHEGRFEIGIEPIEAFIANSKGVVEPPPAPVIAEISRLQRVYQLTPDDQTMAVLLQNNHDSAYLISRYDSAGFVRAFQDKLGDSATAMAIHARAKQIFSATLNIALSYLTARAAPPLGGNSLVHLPFRARQELTESF
jgi:GH18 family chitinase